MTLAIDTAAVHLVWLRDNCRCHECYNWETHQRNNINIPNIYSMESYTRNGESIQIVWSDGHKSQYNVHWVLDQHRSDSKISAKFWNAREIRSILPVIESVNDKLTENDTKTLITALLRLGVAFVQNVNPTKESTEKIVKHIGPFMNTLYGGMWETHADEELYGVFRDTAYTTEYLSCHTDNTYFIESPGLQVFHCTKAAEEGGETLLVDGFKAAELLKEQNIAFYESLKSTPIEWQYITNDYHLRHISKILKTREMVDELEQVRFNIYDRSPRPPFTKNMDLFYQSVSSFQKLLQDSTLQLRVQLQPGTVSFINNWRVLHGRTSFRGRRKLHGCYVAMGTLLSKARKLKIL